VNHDARVWGLVPAAGRGERLGSETPKQYMTVAGRCLLEHSVDALLSHTRVEGVTVALAPEDEAFASLRFSRPGAVDSVTGGASRAESVFNGLCHIAERHGSDWVLVHDAARPCLPRSRLDALIEQGLRVPDGALLAIPVADTLKQAGPDGRVARTVDRDRLWAAQTPQLFPLKALQAALEQALERNLHPTDEAEAMELAGYHPLLVAGDVANLKVTWPADLVVAEALVWSGEMAE